jgi:hypothetical protein
MKTIQEELGGVSRGRNGRNTKVFDQKWDDTKSILIKNCQKMRRMNPAALILVFKEITLLFLDLPWNEYKDIST